MPGRVVESTNGVAVAVGRVGRGIVLPGTMASAAEVGLAIGAVPIGCVVLEVGVVVAGVVPAALATRVVLAVSVVLAVGAALAIGVAIVAGVVSGRLTPALVLTLVGEDTPGETGAVTVGASSHSPPPQYTCAELSCQAPF